jgi:predicted permease
VVNTLVLQPLPYGHPDRLVYIASTAPGSDMQGEFGGGDEFYLQYKEKSHLLEDVAVFNSFTNTMRTPDRVERIRMSAPTNSIYSTLGARPILGRLPVAEDEDNVVVISYALWNSWFGKDPSVLGKVYEMGGKNRQIVGVMGPDFRFPSDNTMLWISGEILPKDVRPGQFGDEMIGRLAPGATIEAVTTELTGLAKQLPERFGGPATYAAIIARHRAVVRPLADQMLGSVARSLWVLLGAVAIVLIIACANVANLFLVRAEGRQRDLAVRRALGAGRGQLIRLQLAESLIVAGLAGGLAVILASVTFPIFLHAAPADVPRLGDVGMDKATLLFAALAALATGIACGAVPALRGSSPDFQRLRDGGRGSTRRRHWGRNGLVIAQTALALVLLIGSGLLVRSFRALRHVDPGYTTKDIFTFQIAPSRPTLNDGPTFAQFDQDFMDRLRALPGVESVGLVDNIPLDESTYDGRFVAEGSSTGSEGGTLLKYTFSAGDYFKSMQIPVLAGRTFETSDHRIGIDNVVISKSAAKLLWPSADPIGRRVQFQGDSVWHNVIGVVGDVMQGSFRDVPQAVIYLPLVGHLAADWRVSSPAFVVKTRRAETIAPEVRALVRQVAPEAPMYRIYTMAYLAERSLVSLTFTMMTLGVLSALALILGAVGLYGVLSFIVAERTREIGVRMALGAQAEQVRGMVVAQGARVVGAGIVIGVVVAFASTKALSGLLYGVQALDLTTFIGMSCSMVVIGLLASYLPARRASSVDPIESLRGD